MEVKRKKLLNDEAIISPVSKLCPNHAKGISDRSNQYKIMLLVFIVRAWQYKYIGYPTWAGYKLTNGSQFHLCR